MKTISDALPVLKGLGLENKEARIYLELLHLGEATATELSHRTTIDRTLIYQLVDKLGARGLLSQTITNGVRHYVAARPAHLQSQLEEKQDLLRSILPFLNGLVANASKATSVELLQGKEGLRKILRDILLMGEDYDIFGESGEFASVIPRALERHYQKLEQRNIAERVLLREGRAIYGGKTQTVRFLPADYLTKVTTVIYGSCVAIFIWSLPYYGIIINSEDVADSYRVHFNMLWKIAKE